MATLSRKQVIRLMKERIEALGSQAAFAKACGISTPLVNMVLRGKKTPGPSITRYLGLSIIRYERYSEDWL